MQKNSADNYKLEVSTDCDSWTCIKKIVKSNREIFIILSLVEMPMCGYDIIKTIFIEYKVFLSQGTVYPILYSLVEQGLLYAEYGKGDMRSKRYNLTSQGKEIAKTKMTEFISAMNYITQNIQR